MSAGRIKVYVRKAANLVKAHPFPFCSDPYVAVNVGNAFRATKVISNTVNPEWNEMFPFHVGSIHDVLRIEVWGKDDKNPEDIHLGDLDLYLPSIAAVITQNRRVEMNFALENIEHGQLYVGIEMEGNFDFGKSHPRGNDIGRALKQLSKMQLKNSKIHQLRLYYRALKHDISVDQAEKIIAEFAGREHELSQILKSKYGRPFDLEKSVPPPAF